MIKTIITQIIVKLNPQLMIQSQFKQTKMNQQK